MAELLGINRKRIYYHLIHPAYGHKRISLALGYNKKKISRIMRKYGLKPPRGKRQKLWLTRSVDNHHYTNLIKGIVPARPSQIFVSDLTYLKYQSKFIYLATVEDIFTREILSAELADKHDSLLALATIKRAVNRNAPEIFHCDQGSEFMAEAVIRLLEGKGIKISVSDKGAPWQNGYKESFFSRFKDENGDLNRFESLGELIEEAYAYIHYYNHLRIHTSLKMTPFQFRQKHADFVSRKLGT